MKEDVVGWLGAMRRPFNERAAEANKAAQVSEEPPGERETSPPKARPGTSAGAQPSGLNKRIAAAMDFRVQRFATRTRAWDGTREGWRKRMNLR